LLLAAPALSTALLLARDGHSVTVLERDPAAPPPPDRAAEAWDGWQRRGVNQFRLPHLMLPRWWSLVRDELPETRAALSAAGARHLNTLAVLPEARRGPLRPDDARFDTVTARRPVLEAALAAAAEEAGVEVRRGVTVTGLTTSAEAAPRTSSAPSSTPAAPTRSSASPPTAGCSPRSRPRTRTSSAKSASAAANRMPISLTLTASPAR